MVEDYLQKIIDEQRNYHEKIDQRIRMKYPSQSERVFAYSQAILSEASEIHRELKPLWSWWRENSSTKWFYNFTDEQKEKLIEEGIDLWKFLNEYLIELGVDTSELAYWSYMKKHEIINRRLVEEGVIEK